MACLTTFYEYSTVLVIIGFWYSGKSTLYRGALVMVSAMYAAQNFIYGGRVTGLQLILIVVFSLYAEKLSLQAFLDPGNTSIPSDVSYRSANS